MSQQTGRVVISISGQRYRSKEGATLDTGGKVREPALSDSGVDGFVERIVNPTVDFTLNHNPNISLTALQAMTNETLTFETDTGVIFTIREAWCAQAPKMTKGEVSLQFAGVECVEG